MYATSYKISHSRLSFLFSYLSSFAIFSGNPWCYFADRIGSWLSFDGFGEDEGQHSLSINQPTSAREFVGICTIGSLSTSATDQILIVSDFNGGSCFRLRANPLHPQLTVSARLIGATNALCFLSFYYY